MIFSFAYFLSSLVCVCIVSLVAIASGVLPVAAQELPASWSVPVHYTRLNSPADDYAPFFSQTTKQLYFTSERSGKAHIYRSSIENVSRSAEASGIEEIPAPLNLPDKHSSYLRLHPRDGSALLTGYRATRAGAKLNVFATSLRNNSFAPTESLAWLNTNSFVAHAVFSPSGTSIAFASNRTDYRNVGGCDLFLAELVNGTWRISNFNTRTANGIEQGPNSERDEITPFFASDSVLFFASNGHTDSTTDFNIFSIVRDENGRWSAPKFVESLNSPADDTDPCLLADGTMLFASNRLGGMGGFDLYYARPDTSGVPRTALGTAFAPTLAPRQPVRPEILIRAEPDRVVLRNYALLEAFPLLPLVFFAEQSSQFPAELTQLNAADSTPYNPDRIRAASLTAYFEILNILGKRMQSYRQTTIELIGTALSTETGSSSAKELARARAETIRQYLQKVWHIADHRMTIRTNVIALPNNATLTQIEDARTVEIRTASPDLLAAIPIRMEQFSAYPDTLAIHLEKRDTIAYTQWTLSAYLQSTPLITNSGKVLPIVERIPLAQQALVLQQSQSNIAVQATISSGVQGESPFSATLTIPIERVPDTRRDSVSRFMILIPADNAKAVLTQEHRSQLATIAKRITKGMRITMRATFDALTPAVQAQTMTNEYAELMRTTLVQLLAPAIASSVHFDVRSVGRTLLYDNTKSYGRYYSRAVSIDIERP